MNHRIRRVTLSGVVTTFAGNGVATYIDGQGTVSSFNSPQYMSFDANGTLYVAGARVHQQHAAHTLRALT